MRENKVREFLNERFGNVRTVNVEGNIWTIADDVCRILEIKNTSDALKKFKEGKEKDIITVLCDVDNNYTTSKARKTQDMLFVSEQGLYKLIFKSRKPFAEEFQDWICGEVIPTLRKDGMYVNGEEDVESVEELTQLVDEAMERKVLRKFGIGVRKDWSKTIEDNWNIRNKFQFATYTNELVYKPIFNRTAKQLKEQFKVVKLRDDLFTLEELSNVAKLENEICTLVEFGADYYGVKKYITEKYKAS